MSGAIEYQVVSRMSRKELVEAVQSFVNIGWEPKGGLRRFRVKDDPEAAIWAQAITRAARSSGEQPAQAHNSAMVPCPHHKKMCGDRCWWPGERWCKAEPCRPNVTITAP